MFGGPTSVGLEQTAEAYDSLNPHHQPVQAMEVFLLIYL